MRAAVSRQGFTCGLRLSAAGMLPHESPDRFFSSCRYALGCEGPFEESAVKGSNNINLEQGLSCVNAIRKRCLFD